MHARAMLKLSKFTGCLSSIQIRLQVQLHIWSCADLHKFDGLKLYCKLCVECQHHFTLQGSRIEWKDFGPVQRSSRQRARYHYHRHLRRALQMLPTSSLLWPSAGQTQPAAPVAVRTAPRLRHRRRRIARMQALASLQHCRPPSGWRPLLPEFLYCLCRPRC